MSSRTQELINTGRRVAHLLPGPWRLNEAESWLADGETWAERLVLQHDEDRTRKIFLRDDWKDSTKWRITGDHQRLGQGIGCSKSRSCKAIAGEIERRFLDAYLEAHAEWKEHEGTRHQAYERYEIQRDLVMRTIPGTSEYGDGRKNGEKRIHFDGGVMKTYVGYTSKRGEWTVELNLSFEDAMRVLCMLKKEQNDE